jgi:hypothetical protein
MGGNGKGNSETPVTQITVVTQKTMNACQAQQRWWLFISPSDAGTSAFWASQPHDSPFFPEKCNANNTKSSGKGPTSPMDTDLSSTLEA